MQRVPQVEAGPVYLGRRVVGHLTSDGTYHRTVRAGHLLRHPPSIAVDSAVLADLDRRGCTALVFTLDGGEQLTATLQQFLGPPSFTVDRGHGQQRAVELAKLASVELRRGTVAELAPLFADLDGWSW